MGRKRAKAYHSNDQHLLWLLGTIQQRLHAADGETLSNKTSSPFAKLKVQVRGRSSFRQPAFQSKRVRQAKCLDPAADSHSFTIDQQIWQTYVTAASSAPVVNSAAFLAFRIMHVKLLDRLPQTFHKVGKTESFEIIQKLCRALVSNTFNF